MTDDLLKRASAALREETAGADEGARFTRARVMASLQQSQVRRRSRLAVLLPLAACFAAATAFGMVNGQVPAFVRSVSHTLGFGEAPEPAPARRNPPAALPAPSPAPSAALAPPAELPLPVEAPTSPVEAPTLAPRTEVSPRPRERSAPLAASAPVKVEPPRSSAPSAPAPSALGDVSDRAHELYRVAHRTHFVDHDFVSALRAWDAYLDAAPDGRFVLEARYNRALCLVRLGRTTEAREALAPFASGKFAGYRQEAARALIDAMNH